jgi:hypothetical protein
MAVQVYFGKGAVEVEVEVGGGPRWRMRLGDE